ncbi:hypothetical protein Tco_1288606, partial [Tanacetum coccineum]
MHNMGNTIGELHALFIEYEKGLLKKAATSQVLAIQGDYGILVAKNDVRYFNVIPHDGIYEIDTLNLVPNVNSIYNVSNKRAKHNLDYTYLLHYRRATDLLRLIPTDVCGPLRHLSRQGASYFITFTDDFSRYRAAKLKEIQDGDTPPAENTIEHLVEAESFETLQEDVALVCRSISTYRAPERLWLNVEVEEHSPGDLNEPANYKDALLDLESNNWLDAMNA